MGFHVMSAIMKRDLACAFLPSFSSRSSRNLPRRVIFHTPFSESSICFRPTRSCLVHRTLLQKLRRQGWRIVLLKSAGVSSGKHSVTLSMASDVGSCPPAWDRTLSKGSCMVFLLGITISLGIILNRIMAFEEANGTTLVVGTDPASHWLPIATTIAARFLRMKAPVPQGEFLFPLSLQALLAP